MYVLICSKNHLLNQREGRIKVMEKVPSWMERLLLPKLNEITGEIKAIHTHIDAVWKEIVSLRNETKTEITSLRDDFKVRDC
jgi:hypothetical protein